MMETGWVKVSSTDVIELHYKYKKEKEDEKWVVVPDSEALPSDSDI